jgi:triosephosphate isomerase
MNTERASGVALADAIVRGITSRAVSPLTRVVLCPPFPLIPLLHDVVRNSVVRVGAQNVHHKPSGAYTGEVSAEMLVSLGCEYVIIGHSERRMYVGESDQDVNFKLHHVLTTTLEPIVCVGETRIEREEGTHLARVDEQIRAGFANVLADEVGRCIVAYEPVWAIGTGQVATPQQANEMHAHIRSTLVSMFGATVADDVSIIYGGSVKASNAAEIFAQPDVDGALVGGASLAADEFLSIVASFPNR